MSTVMRGGLLTVVPDTAARRHLSAPRMLLLSAFWLAIAYLWQPMTFIVVPNLVQRLVHPTPLQLGPVHFVVDAPTYLGILEGIGAIFAVIWQPAVGALSDRSQFAIGRRRPYIAVGVIGDVIFLVLVALATSYWSLLIFYALLQMASNTAQGPYQGMLPDQVPEDQRGEASGYYGGLQMAGTLLGLAVIAIILGPQHLRTGILSIALVLAVTGAMVIFGAPDVRSTQAREQSIGRSIALSFVLDVRRYPDFAWLMGSRLLFLIAVGGIQKYALFYLQYAFHLTPVEATQRAGILIVAITAVAGLVSTSAGHLADRLGKKRLVALACVVGAVGSLLAVNALTYTAVLIFGALLGIATGAFLSVDWAFATDLIPKAEAGRYMGVSNIATASSGILAGFLMGPVIDAVNGGHPGIAGYRVMFGIATGFFLIALLTLRPVREIKVR